MPHASSTSVIPLQPLWSLCTANGFPLQLAEQRVGEDNHHIFLLTIIYTLFFCITTLILTVLHFYYYPKCITCDKQIFYIKHSIWFIYTLNVILIYGLFQSLIMFVVQHLNIIMNRTTVENVLLTPVV
ncbi:probable palmitoyltransferase ZDHHC21, partial [Octopus sinensis]|uniref:Palmitoyltransferase n=1 Tax=Octopus sinensis TaxID=2607531 RepID=A0A7E6EN16_9MOLL